MKSKIESDLSAAEPERRVGKKVPVCLLTRIAFYGCLALAMVTLGIFLVTNLRGQ